MGITYRFRVAARNQMGYSIKSQSVSILAAQEPNKPNKPVTTLVGENVVITWTAPLNGGSPILMYQIRIRQNDGVSFRPDLTYCDGSKSAIIVSLSCSVPVVHLKAEPYSLASSGPIFVKIQAVNSYGSS